MKSKITNFFLCFLLVLSWSCSEKQTKPNEIILQTASQKIQDILSVANCDSPFGKYITEVRSFKDGSCYFRQKFDDADSPFIVKVDTLNRGYIFNESDALIDTLSGVDVEVIRGHEFHKMSINPNFYFKKIKYSKKMKLLGVEYDVYSGYDKLNNPVALFYNSKKQLISKIELLNPKDKSQSIEILFDKWIQSKYGDFAKAIKIIQAKKDTFYFDIETLKVRTDTGYVTLIN